MVSISFDRTWERLALIGAGATALGSIPVWVTMTVAPSVAEATTIPEHSTRGGIVGDGTLTVFLAILTVGVVIRSARRDHPRWTTSLLVVVAGALSAVTAAVAYRDARVLQTNLESLESADVITTTSAVVTTNTSVWLWLVLGGGLSIAASGLVPLFHALRGESGSASPDT